MPRFTLLLCFLLLTACTQTARQPQPPITGYDGIILGMSADQAVAALRQRGKPLRRETMGDEEIVYFEEHPGTGGTRARSGMQGGFENDVMFFLRRRDGTIGYLLLYKDRLEVIRLSYYQRFGMFFGQRPWDHGQCVRAFTDARNDLEHRFGPGKLEKISNDGEAVTRVSWDRPQGSVAARLTMELEGPENMMCGLVEAAVFFPESLEHWESFFGWSFRL